MRISYRVVTIFGSLVMLLIAVVFFGLLLGEDFLRVTSLLTDSEETKIAKLVADFISAYVREILLLALFRRIKVIKFRRYMQ